MSEPAPLMRTRGTPEQVWQEWGGLLRGPSWSPPVVRLGTARATVVAAHPDDETLAVGGLMQLLAAAGWDLGLVVLTDGEASHEDWADRGARGLAATRRAEFARAMELLGVGPRVVAAPGLPDGGVADLADELVDLLDPYLAESELVIAPHPLDGHPDHDACGVAARDWARSAGVPSLAYGVWLWDWTLPGALQFEWNEAVRVALPPEVVERKRAAIEAYRSQLDARPGEDAILPPAVLDHHLRDVEILFPTNGALP